MKETWMETLLQEYDRDLPKTVLNEIRKLAAWIVLRFAIPETELPNLCWLLMNKKEGKNPERDGKDIRETYRFFILENVFWSAGSPFDSWRSSVIGSSLWAEGYPTANTDSDLEYEKGSCIHRRAKETIGSDRKKPAVNRGGNRMIREGRDPVLKNA